MSTETEAVLKARDAPELAGRLAVSAAAKARVSPAGRDDPGGWLAARNQAHRCSVERIPFAGLDRWSFEDGTGNLVHSSGRFFAVEGLRVTVAGRPAGPFREWQQPIIVQPEVGVLGILVKEFDGVLHFLMHAKMEPGNPNLTQLSPTVQATYSNYTRVHRGAAVRYLEYFLAPGRGGVLADVLQSEHGSWFLQKVNRNMIVEARGPVSLHEDYCWLTLGQIGELLRCDNVVNMDTRTVVACAPTGWEEPGALVSDTGLLSWFAAERCRHDLRAQRMPLAQVAGWLRDEWSIRHAWDWFFKVVAVSVHADNREVTRWTQPLLEPVRPGVTAFVVRRFGGVPHMLVHARVECGFLGTIELGPTVQCTPAHHEHLPAASRPPFLDLVLGRSDEHIRYAAMLSEEGGRLLNAQSRYLIVEADEAEAPTRPPPGYLWVTPGQLSSLVRHSHYVNVQARSLLAAVNAQAVDLSG
jgi:dTDP-4-dehydro-6-deoxy-alpha-D-glucopyranose 2,3-dehydratase